MKKMRALIFIIVMLFSLVSCKGKKEVTEEEKAIIKNAESITLAIAEIEDGYFLAEQPWPSPLHYKVYASLDMDYCVGDYVEVYYEKIVEIDENQSEITALLVGESDFKLEEGKSYKPIIYLYPTKETKIFVSLDYNGTLTHTYPEYVDGWEVLAHPNGTLVDNNGIEYPYLFWEGDSDIEYDMSKGFCISGKKTEEFLREKLDYMGLNEKELEEFIEFWVPFMKENPYNKICFQTKSYTDNAELKVTPTPDSMLRIYMVYQPLKNQVPIQEQPLSKFKRIGFAVVEWGGSIITKR